MYRPRFASKRSIGKQGIWSKAPVPQENKEIKHNNRAGGKGRRYRVQNVVLRKKADDANDTLLKRIIHVWVPQEKTPAGKKADRGTEKR